jgi:hypothetical protein
VNVLTHARSVFPSVPLYGVMGGLHLSGATEKVIPETVADLQQFGMFVFRKSKSIPLSPLSRIHVKKFPNLNRDQLS